MLFLSWLVMDFVPVLVGLVALTFLIVWLLRTSAAPRRPLTPPERRTLERLFPWLGRLDLSQRAAWERQVARFLARVTFEGCGGFEITDHVRLVIAAQACLLTVGRDEDPFPRLSTVLVYPAGFTAPTSHVLGPDIVIERRDERIGESWQRGQVVLAWEEIDPEHQDPRRAGNLVFHEFAHQLDAENGADDGVPVLRRGFTREWQRVMRREYERLQEDYERGDTTFLDPYGTENPAEFFAVATESYFQEGADMKRRHPDLYRVLRTFYRVDGASLSR